MPLVLFNPYIGLYQVLPRRARLDLGAMAMKRYSAFPKAPASLESLHQIVYCHFQDNSRCILQPQLTEWTWEQWQGNQRKNRGHPDRSIITVD